MRLLIAVEQRYERGKDDHFYAEGPARYASWANYLEAFEEVTVVARAGPAQKKWREEERADGPGVSFCPLPDYRGPWEFLRRQRELRPVVRQALAHGDACILRVPGLVGRLAWQEIRRAARPYALEVVGDPWDALGPGTWPSLLRPVFRRVGARDLATMCRDAAAIHYVTERTLQRRYPPGPHTYSAGFSDALMKFAFAEPETIARRFQRIAEHGGNPSNLFRIGFLGSLAQLYKGPDVLLHAVERCVERGMNLDVWLVGEGRYAGPMRVLAHQLRLTGRLHFLGHLLYGEAIFRYFDLLDLFVMPSRAEGLPRALLEAMARGCPAIGSDVGGISELLAAEDLVPVGDAKSLGEKIRQVAGDPARRKRMSERNLERARQFRPEVQEEKRREFLRVVRERAGGTHA
jgi:glycosyltransferase involved in cell wall biosynthesis